MFRTSKPEEKKQPEPTTQPRWKQEGFFNGKHYTEPDQTITLRVVQLPVKEIQKICGQKGAGECHVYDSRTKVHTVYIPRLTSDYDYLNQNLLGHAVHHALGMKH